MTPALITIGFRYNLTSTTPDRFYLKLYNDSLNSVFSDLNSYKQLGITSATNFINISKTHQNEIQHDVNMLIANFTSRVINQEIPFLKDENGILKFKFTKIFSLIKEADTSTQNFSIELSFITEELTLIGTMADKMLLTNGDKSADLKNNIPISHIAFLKQTPDIWFNTYKKI